MTKNNSFKKQIRSRMALTGETYAQAREALYVEHIPLKELLEAGLVLPSKDPKNRRLEDIFTPSELHDLKKSLVQRETVIVAGGAGTGKTAVLNTILNTYGVESRKPHGIESRTISIEENICELDVVEGDHFQLLTRDTTSVEALLPNVMRMRPDAVAVGEIRINEMWMLHRLVGMGTGSFGTLHCRTMTQLAEYWDFEETRATTVVMMERLMVAGRKFYLYAVIPLTGEVIAAMKQYRMDYDEVNFYKTLGTLGVEPVESKELRIRNMLSKQG